MHTVSMPAWEVISGSQMLAVFGQKPNFKNLLHEIIRTWRGSAFYPRRPDFKA